MVRGPARAPSPNAYRGAIGRTHTTTIHVTTPGGDLVAATVHTSIDAVADPELAQRVQDGDRTLNTVRVGDETVAVPVPLIYHDPAAELIVLVLAEAHRHRELDERIHVLEQLRDDHATVPRYAKEFAVVFGAHGLRAYLEERAQQAMAARAQERALERDKEREREKDREPPRRSQSTIGQRAVEPRIPAPEPRIPPAEPPATTREHSDLVARAFPTPSPSPSPSPTPIAVPAAGSAPSFVAVPAAERLPLPPPPPPPDRDDLHTKPVPRSSTDADEVSTDPRGALADEPETMRVRGNDFEHEGSTNVDAGPHVDSGPGKLGTVANGTRAHVTGQGSAPPSRVTEDEEPTGHVSTAHVLPQGSDALTTETSELPPISGDAWLDFAATGVTSSFQVSNGHARLALVAGEQLARGLGGPLDVRVLLLRATSYPVIALLIGPPLAMRVPSLSQVAVLALDVGNDLDRAVLAALSDNFELIVDVIVRGRAIRRVQLAAPLADNVTYVLRAADDHLRALTADGDVEVSFARARDLVLGPNYDLFGTVHGEHGEFREDKLAQLTTAQHVRRALAITRRFVRPSREDYLVCARGFPLTRWHELRRNALKVAVGWGLWMGPELAQVAVAEGLARSRRELVSKLDAGFDVLRHDADAFDLDSDAAEDNWKALTEEARGQGVELKRRVNGTIKSEDVPVVSGSIERTPTEALPQGRSLEELIKLLDDKTGRVTAAAELCDRGDPRAAEPVIAAVKKMSRAEAVRILGKSVKFGDAAARPLIEGLASSKAFLRHGCALALALLRSEEGSHAVIDLLFEEPTEIWREIARAVGQIGPTALMPLASHVGRTLPVSPTVAERTSWAMAHVGVRGGKHALEQMAGGTSVMAPLAKQALVLLETAARDEVRVRPGAEARDVTVNRAFSRRFFEALEADRPDVAHAALHGLDVSSPHELQDADLIVEEDEAELDESDLIQS